MARQAERDSKFSRRIFLGGAAAGVAAGALESVSTASAQTSGAVQDMRTDVVIVGSGIGGLTAALRAQKAGANVIVLEKAYEPGGTTSHSEGGVWTAESYEDMRNDAPGGDPQIQRTVFDTLPETYKFYESVGAPLAAARGGTTRMRSIPPVSFCNYMVKSIQSGGGQVLVETPMLRLLTNQQLEVIGVLAENAKGPLRILARAVVLATGGWAGNAQLVTQNITRQFGSLHQRNTSYGGRKPFLTGDGLAAATHIGAAVSQGSWDGFYGHGMPYKPAKPLQNPLATYSLYHGPWSIAVNMYGRRFADEGYGRIAGRPVRGGAGEHCINQEVARQPEASCAYIWDAPVDKDHACADCVLGSLDKFPAFRDVGSPAATANTLEELAKQMEAWGKGMEAETILRELNEYNQAAKNGKAWALPIPKADKSFALPLQTPPYFTVMATAGITATHGGLKINPQGQVLSRTGRPIKGLYAAGVDVGNFNDYVYLGNLCLGAVFGYIAGPLAAKQTEPQGGWEIGPFS